MLFKLNRKCRDDVQDLTFMQENLHHGSSVLLLPCLSVHLCHRVAQHCCLPPATGHVVQRQIHQPNQPPHQPRVPLQFLPQVEQGMCSVIGAEAMGMCSVIVQTSAFWWSTMMVGIPPLVILMNKHLLCLRLTMQVGRSNPVNRLVRRMLSITRASLCSACLVHKWRRWSKISVIHYSKPSV